jgi:hypothetical protein
VKFKLKKYDFVKLREKKIQVKKEDIKKLEESVNGLRANYNDRRMLQQVQADEIKAKEDLKMNYVESECDLSPESLLKECKFTWDMVQSKDQKEILIKFNFKEKALVSLGDEADYVLVKFWGAPFILTDTGEPIFKEAFAVRVRIPLQMDGESTSVITTQVLTTSIGKGGEIVLWV